VSICGNLICATCPHWQGTAHSKWGDCYYIIGILWPKTLTLMNRFGHPLRIPFDAHDIKYFDEKVYKYLDFNLPDGVRYEIRKENDLTFDEEGNERIRRVKLCYFLTRRDFVCAGLTHGIV
jgi:hypothetical protein